MLVNWDIIYLLMKSSRAQRESGNDFLDTPHSNRQRVRQKQKLSQDIKAKYIQELQQRNRKLKYEIIKINEMLQEQKDKSNVPKKEHKLIPQQSSADVIKKELENVYKQIKNYEREINNLESKQSGGLITDKMSRLENILKEKTSHLEKLKNELSLLAKNSVDNQKKLKNNAGREELETAMLKYNDEIKVLREKVRLAEEKEKKKMENAKKQFDYIKKLEKELVQNGVSHEELQEMKKNNIYSQIYQKLNSDEKMPDKPGKKQEKHQEIQDMTVDRFAQLKNQVKLYKKLHQDYDKRLQALQKERLQEQKKTSESRKKLEEREADIKKLQQQINQLKVKMRKNNIKANFTAQKQQSKQKSKEKIKPPTTKVKNPNIKTISDQTHLKYDQKGLATEKGQRFTDRAIIGKVSNSRIVLVKVWTQKTSFAICGLQCFYKIGDQIRPGNEHISRQAKKGCTENVMQLADGDFVKNISGHLSQTNIIEYLVMISANSIVGRFGVAKPTQKQFNFDIDEDQIPICLYGSLITIKDSKRELSYVEQIGFEISRDKNFEKDNKLI